MPKFASRPLLYLAISTLGLAAEQVPVVGAKPEPAEKSGYATHLPAAVAPGHTIAHRLLALELEGDEAPALLPKLNELIEQSVARFGQIPTGELEPATTERFFRTVDTILIENGVIFPPRGKIELLRDALMPRQPTDTELARAMQEFANARRSRYIQILRKAGEPLFYFDCDLAAVIYVAVAERLKLPVQMVELPGHNFVRWQSPGVSHNWDPNDGISKSDQHFAQVAGVTAEDQRLFGYLETLSAPRIQSYWLVRRGQRKAAAGGSAAGLADYREAVKISPDDLAAANELAWLLATAPDEAVRNGPEALALAQNLVAQSRRLNWLETLAAAYAETGDFAQAIATEEEARSQAVAWLQATKRRGSLAGFDACLKAYRQNQTYAAAVKAGLIK